VQIAHGVSFRFENVKDVFYHYFLRNQGSVRDSMNPPILPLTVNFRTHEQVLALARSVVYLILQFFPNSVDKMKDETSTKVGEKPISLTLQGPGSLVNQLFGTDPSQVLAEFGAEQVILVRDEETKARVKRETDGNALVLTVLESKGMEFEDCLVLDFFSSSPFKDDWRVVLQKLHEDPDTEAVRAKQFDMTKHNILSTELKMLYVLITRAKRGLVFYDQNADAFDPMFRYWSKRQLIEVKPLDEDIRNRYNVKSTPEQWQAKAITFMEKKQFMNAKFCFEKAGDIRSAEIAVAADFEERGDRTLRAEGRVARIAESPWKSLFISAGEVHLVLSNLADAARCFSKAHEYVRAADCFTELNDWNSAGAQFKLGNMFDRAANSYWRADDLKNALECSYNSDPPLFRDALSELLLAKERGLDFDFQQMTYDCHRTAALYHHHKQNPEEMFKFVSEFPSLAEKKAFLKRYSNIFTYKPR